MARRSKKASKAKLTGSAVKKDRDGSKTTIAELSEDLGEIDDAEGEVTFGNSITMAGVFGDYTSLQTSIYIKMPIADLAAQATILKTFDKVLEPFNERILHTIQRFQNDVLERVGVAKIWGAKKPEGKA
jgi:hypothetical protein